MRPLNPAAAALLAALTLPGASLAALVLPPPVALPAAPSEPRCTSSDFGTARGCLAGALTRVPDRKKDVAERLVEFLFDPAGGAGFVAKAVAEDKASEKVRQGMKNQVRDWASKASSDDLSALYYLMGAGSKVPGWVKQVGLEGAMSAPRGDCLGSLRKALADWAGKVAKAEDVSGLLLDAKDKAHGILSDNRCKIDVERSVAEGERAKPEDGAPARSPMDGSGSGFGFEDLYVKGAVVQDVYGPKDDGFRRLSMKLYTVKDADGQLQTMIGVVDITPNDPNTPYKPHFIPLTQSGEAKFTLRNGGREYVLDVSMADGRRNISLSRPGTEDGKGQALKTSIEGLATLRADQAAASGLVKIGDAQYYALGQGGENGSILFFPKELVDGRGDAKDPRYLRPAAMADVSMVDKDGLTVPVQYNPDLGSLPDGTSPDGSVIRKPFYLVFDAKLKIWKVASGVNPNPKPKPKAAAGEAAGGKGGGSGQGGAGEIGAAGASTLDEAANAARQAGWDVDIEVSEEVRDKIRIASRMKGDSRVFSILFAPDLGVKGNQVAVPSRLKNGSVLQSVRNFKDNLVLEYQGQIMYFGVDDFIRFTMQQTFEVSGTVQNEQMSDVQSLDIARDALVHYFGVKPGDARFDAKNIPARVLKRAKGKSCVFNGNDKVLNMDCANKAWEIWPGDKEVGEKGTNSAMAGLKGPGTAYGISGGAFKSFPNKVGAGAGRDWLLGEKRDDVALYKTQEDYLDKDGKARTADAWGIMFAYQNGGGEKARTKMLLLFGDNPDRLPMPAANYGMKGLSSLSLPDTAQIMLLHGSSQEAGAVAVYRSALPAADGSNVKDKDGNCAGVVFWWGLDKSKADKACPAGKL